MSDIGVTPAVGQVWIDNDPRCEGRKLLVERIEDDPLRGRVAICRPLTEWDGTPVTRARLTSIRIDRMKPTSNGYRLDTTGANP